MRSRRTRSWSNWTPDKVSLEVAAPADGVLEEIVAAEGRDGDARRRARPRHCRRGRQGSALLPRQPQRRRNPPPLLPAKLSPKRRKASPRLLRPGPGAGGSQTKAAAEPVLAPSAQRVAAESQLDVSTITGTGKDGRITKGDALAALEARSTAPAPAAAARPRRARCRSAKSACG
jgi:2-oxoglutarate dehydrogenase E2 component (dihydrolipoamide succinyltransferase)